MFRKALFLLFLVVSFARFSHAQTFPLRYTLNGVKDTMAWLCQVQGKEVFAIDSCILKDETALFEVDSMMPHGVYKIVFNDTLFTDIIYAGEAIRLISALPDIIGSMQVMQSEENRLLFGYWQFYFRIQDTLDQVIQRGRELYYASQGKPSRELDLLELRSDQLEKQKIDYILDLMRNHPGRFAPKLVWSFQKPDYRFYLIHNGTPYPSEKAFYEQHFFDRLDFSDKRMLNTEVLFVMINDYMRTFAQPPSSATYITLIEHILSKARVSPEVYQYCIELFIQNFEVGIWEQVFVHLVSRHYLTSPLGNATMKEVYRERVEAIRNTAVGAKAPEVCGLTPAGERKCLSEELGTRTILLIWSEGCDHCEAILPDLVKVSKEYAEKGLKIFAFTFSEEPATLNKAMEQFGITWVNISDYKGLFSPVMDDFNITLTPVMYLLDKNGVITDKPLTIPVLYSNLVVRYKDGE
jgi:thiol-disulfide isomerase/thioredoxin